MEAAVQVTTQATQPADVGVRILGYLIDVVPIVIVSIVLSFIPILGPMLAGLLGIAYWLLRDIVGASLGKKLLGTCVFLKDGSEAPKGKLVLRNVTLALPYAAMLIPLLGYVLGPLVSVIVGIVELVMLITKKERLGDMLANTAVFKIAK
jgi:uncharacterized RDD family membrane protein YckC